MEASVCSTEQETGHLHKRRKLIAWDSVHAIFKQLYKDEGRNLSETMCILRVQYGFEASERSFKNQMKAWGISKYKKKSLRGHDTHHLVPSKPRKIKFAEPMSLDEVEPSASEVFTSKEIEAICLLQPSVPLSSSSLCDAPTEDRAHHEISRLTESTDDSNEEDVLQLGILGTRSPSPTSTLQQDALFIAAKPRALKPRYSTLYRDPGDERSRIWREALIIADNVAVVEMILRNNNVSAARDCYPWSKIWTELLTISDCKGGFHTRKLLLMLKVWKPGNAMDRNIPPDILRLGLDNADEISSGEMFIQKAQRDPIFSGIFIQLALDLITSCWDKGGKAFATKEQPLYIDDTQIRSPGQEPPMSSPNPCEDAGIPVANYQPPHGQNARRADCFTMDFHAALPAELTSTRRQREGMPVVAVSADYSKAGSIMDYFNQFVWRCLQVAWDLNLQGAPSSVRKRYFHLFLKLQKPSGVPHYDPQLKIVSSRLYSLLTSAGACKHQTAHNLIRQLVQLHQGYPLSILPEYLKILAPAFELCVSSWVESEQIIILDLLRSGLDIAHASGAIYRVAEVLMTWICTFDLLSNSIVRLLLSTLYHFLGLWQTASLSIDIALRCQTALAHGQLDVTGTGSSRPWINGWLAAITAHQPLAFSSLKEILLGILGRKPWFTFMQPTMCDIENIMS